METSDVDGGVCDCSDSDRTLARITKSKFSSLTDARSALSLAMARLGIREDSEIPKGPASEVWVDQLVLSLWLTLSDLDTDYGSFLHLPFPCHSIGRNNVLLAVSRPWCDLMGYEPDEVIGRKSVEFLTEESRNQAVGEYLPRFWRDGGLTKVKYTMVHKAGHQIPVLMSAAAEFDTNGVAKRSMAIIGQI